MAHWSKIGKDPPRKLLGNRVFALTFASSCSARLQFVQEEEDTAQAPAPKKDFISERLAAYAPEQVEDKWGFYAESGPEPITDTTNLYLHWSAQSYLGGVQQMAYDHLSIPAMSAECERVFSDTKLTISPNRNRLKEDIIEATECLVQWTWAGW